MDKRAFGQALAAEREAHGMSAEGFASAVGIPHNEYLTYERGEVLPSLELAQTFAEALGVPIDRLTSTTYVPPLRMGKEDDISKGARSLNETHLIHRYGQHGDRNNRRDAVGGYRPQAYIRI